MGSSHRSIALVSLLLASCGHGGAGTGGAGGSGGAGVDVCTNADNPPGSLVDLTWPAASNVGHDATEGDTVHFHWSGSHDVLQVATFEGQEMPTPALGDAAWPGEITSGPKRADGFFDWNTGTFPCGYRPGLYFFVDEGNPQGGVVSVSLTVNDGSHFAPRPCSDLANPGLYGGRHAMYADRPGCTVHEVNNFQTEAHFDWVSPIFTAKQGDLVVFRWTGEHNVVQVHDVTQDMPMNGGVDSGPKANCVGGPHYACVNGAPSLGEFVFDTADYHPGAALPRGPGTCSVGASGADPKVRGAAIAALDAAGATGGRGIATGGWGIATGGWGIATGGWGIATGGQGIATGGWGNSHGGQGIATGGWGIATGGRGNSQGGMGNRRAARGLRSAAGGLRPAARGLRPAAGGLRPAAEGIPKVEWEIDERLGAYDRRLGDCDRRLEN
jgi:hypothetical protein